MKRVHPLTALLWVVSLVAVAWMADQLVVSLTALVALCVVAAVAGGPRRAVWRPVREICVVLVVIWALLLAGVLGHVTTTGGIVVTLPSILIGSQQIGGVVHAGPTLNAANHAVQACVAVVAGAVLVQLRPAHDWLDLAMCWLGRGARVMAPGMCMAEGVSVAVADRVRLRRGGLRTSRLQALVDGIDRGREIEDRWEEARLVRSPRSWCRVLGVAGTLVVLLACVRQTMTGWTLWQVAAVDPYWDRALMTCGHRNGRGMAGSGVDGGCCCVGDAQRDARRAVCRRGARCGRRDGHVQRWRSTCSRLSRCVWMSRGSAGSWTTSVCGQGRESPSSRAAVAADRRPCCVSSQGTGIGRWCADGAWSDCLGGGSTR